MSKFLDRYSPNPRGAGKKAFYSAWIIFSVLYYELLLKLLTGGSFSACAVVEMFCFSLSFGSVVFLLSGWFKSKQANRWVGFAFMFLIAVYFLVQYFVRQTFTVFMEPEFMVSMTENVIGSYSGKIVSIIFHGLPVILLYFVPSVGWLIMTGRTHGVRRSTPHMRMFSLICAILLHIVGFMGVYVQSSGAVTDYELYTSGFQFNNAVPRLGLVRSTALDLRYLVFGIPEGGVDHGEIIIEHESDDISEVSDVSEVSDTSDISEISDTSEVVIDTSPNSLDIDFAALAGSESDSTIASMHRFFGSVTPTNKNAYTGLFEGKNLILICAESFSHYAISKELTPTLYMMSTQGYVFTDYYQPGWGGSTSTGEYSMLMGVYPSSSGIMRQTAGKNNYMTVGNRLMAKGYTTLAFHNNTYTYYSRNLTHENLGYQAFIAKGNGLDGLTGRWPESDLEMFQLTVDRYIDSQPFHVYYMTVSGHGGYSFTGNSMSAKNRAAVADLPYSDTVKAYLAANLELEYAMEYLIGRLEDAGILDDTLIVITADHYPYPLDKGVDGNTEDYLAELAGRTLDANFEKYRNSLIMYSGAIEKPVVINDPTYSLDILPTLLNLFGVDYDSRLLMGRDVFSDSDPLVVFPNSSWISSKGRYNASTNTFTAASGASVTQEYVKNTTSYVKNLRNYYGKITPTDYYDYIFGND